MDDRPCNKKRLIIGGMIQLGNRCIQHTRETFILSSIMNECTWDSDHISGGMAKMIKQQTQLDNCKCQAGDP